MKKFSLIFLLVLFCGFAWAEDTPTPTPTPTPYFYLSKSSDKTVYNPGDTITYYLNITTTGGVTNLKVWDTVPAYGDKRIEVLGSNNDGYYFGENNVDWELVTINSGLGINLNNFGDVVYDGKIWKIGGAGNATVAYSVDGTSFITTGSIPNISSSAVEAVVYNGYIYIGSFQNSDSSSVHIWRTNNGVDFEAVTLNANIPARRIIDGGFIVYDNKLWIIGGRVGAILTSLRDVWYSTDGADWTPATQNAQWSGRMRQVVTVFNNKMWVMGGYPGSVYSKQDIWSSTDGITWTQELATAPFDNFVFARSVVHNGRLYITGGSSVYDNTTSRWGVNEVWSTADGVKWVKSTINAPWKGRYLSGAVEFNNSIYIFGGSGNESGTVPADVWKSVFVTPTVQVVGFNPTPASTVVSGGIRQYVWWGKITEGIIGTVKNIFGIKGSNAPVYYAETDIIVNSPTNTPTVTPTITQTVTETATATVTPTITSTVTPTITATPTITLTATPIIKPAIHSDENNGGIWHRFRMWFNHNSLLPHNIYADFYAIKYDEVA
jgi:hypothetical protein